MSKIISIEKPLSREEYAEKLLQMCEVISAHPGRIEVLYTSNGWVYHDGTKWRKDDVQPTFELLVIAIGKLVEERLT